MLSKLNKKLKRKCNRFINDFRNIIFLKNDQEIKNCNSTSNNKIISKFFKSIF